MSQKNVRYNKERKMAKKEGKTAKGRSNDPLRGQTVFIKVPTPDGYANPYTAVPTDPLKLHVGVLTSMFTYDKEDTKVTGARTLKQVLGIEHVVRKYVDTTEITSILKEEMHRLGLELETEHGDVGKYIFKLLEVFEKEIPDLLEMIGQGAMEKAEKVTNALVGMVQKTSKEIANQLALQESFQAIFQAHHECYEKWGEAVRAILACVIQAKEQYGDLDRVLTSVQEMSRGWDSSKNTSVLAFKNALTCVHVGDDEFYIFADKYLLDPTTVSDVEVLARLEPIEESIRMLHGWESTVLKDWNELGVTIRPRIRIISDRIQGFQKELEGAFRVVEDCASQLGEKAPKPYTLEEGRLCTKEEFDRAEKFRHSTDWIGGGCQRNADWRIRSILDLLKTSPPGFSEDVKTKVAFTELYIKRIQEQREKFGNRKPSQPPEDKHDTLDTELVEYVYEMACCVGYVITCNPDEKRARQMHKILHIVAKLPQSKGFMEERDIPLFRQPVNERSHVLGERHVVKIEGGGVSKAWKTASNVKWISFKYPKWGWRIKLAACAAPDALRLMEKHSITAEQVMEAKAADKKEQDEIFQETGHKKKCRCHLFHPEVSDSKEEEESEE